MKVADIHCHILPGVDDGSRDMEQTMRMIKTAYEEDIRLIIATPHYHIGKVKVNSSVAMKYLEQVKTNIKNKREKKSKINLKYFMLYLIMIPLMHIMRV